MPDRYIGLDDQDIFARKPGILDNFGNAFMESVMNSMLVAQKADRVITINKTKDKSDGRFFVTRNVR